MRQVRGGCNVVDDESGGRRLVHSQPRGAVLPQGHLSLLVQHIDNQTAGL